MFDSACEVLNNYLDNVSRFRIYFIEMRRGENLEDLYYLCNVAGAWVVVFETDYFLDPLAKVAKEAADIFGPDVRPLHWLTKKSGRHSNQTVSIKDADDESKRDKLILRPTYTYLRYAVLAVDVDRPVQKHYNPSSYGHFK